ncbi:MAG: DUF4276 family protein [Chloroflexi bacterium]|nr:DUF4276 family protein [Chloroflexota bacterium]
MKKVLIYVEGQTEETFVRDVVGPFLADKHIYLVPILARTKRTRSGRAFKGGIVSYKQVRRDIIRILNDSSASLVTTMIDYYGLPNDFPGKSNMPSGTPYQRVTHLEDAFRRDISHPRFTPFLTLHEFEALLFAQPEEILRAFPETPQADRLITELSKASPEEINEGPQTHPAARIIRYIPHYRKPLHGPIITRRIGLSVIRSKCPHFDQWVTLLETPINRKT